MEKTESKEKIQCAICGEMFPIITPSHLMKKHSISLTIYKEKFPDAPITSSQYKAKQKFLKGSLFSKEEKGNPVVDEIDLGDLTLKTEPELDTELESVKRNMPVREIKSFKGTLDNTLVNRVEIKNIDIKPRIRSEPQIMPEKRKIIDFLQTIFPMTSVVNNFIIEKFYRDGSLEYRYATDIAIPPKNIDLEFVKSFWHNTQILDNYRKHKLERDGWIIIEIQEPSPSIDTVKSYLKHRKLI